MKNNKQQYGSSNVLVRIYEKDLLSADDFDRIIQAENVNDMLQIFLEAYYGHLIKDDEIKNIDDVLDKVLQDAYKKGFKLSPSKLLSEYVSLRYTYHNIKLAFKEQVTGQSYTSLYFPMSLYSYSAIDYAVSSGESHYLDESYLKYINEAKEDYDEYHRLYSIDVIFDRAYQSHLLLLAEKIDDEMLIDYTKRLIDYRNFTTLLRALKQKRTRNFIDTVVLTQSGHLPVEEIAELESFSDVKNYYRRTYMEKIINTLKVDTIEKVNLRLIETLVDDEKMLFLQQAKRTANGPMPLVGFLHAKEIEVKNLRIVSFTKKAHLAVDDIKERLRLNYVT